MTSCPLQSRMTSNMDLKGQLIQGVIVATCFSTFVAAHHAPEPPSSSPASSTSTLWGGTFAFFSLTTDAWPAAKALTSYHVEHSFSVRIDRLAF
ncbi:unnamed protein product [Sphagnum troendelagicum]|uniref:Secreted protein n=1 Tax=Sphagnum troendelagicum TaxID=128251 RepID=A0ABP0UCZ8_9BRYO